MRQACGTLIQVNMLYNTPLSQLCTAQEPVELAPKLMLCLFAKIQNQNYANLSIVEI